LQFLPAEMVSTNRAGWKRRAISESGDAVNPEMAQSAKAARRRLLGSRQ
jgi:hypothetical protein